MKVSSEMEAVTKAVEIDTKIAKTYEKVTSAQARIKNVMVYVRHAVGAWKSSDLNECVEFLARRELSMSPRNLTKANEWIDRAREAYADLESARQAFAEADNQYEGWSRFFLVPGGHIHSSMSCSSCNKNGSMTSFAWLPELSGLTEADAVAKHGSVLCSVCFPTAPVAWTVNKTSKAGA